MRDEGRPLEAGGQEQASNHRKLRRSRAVVVSVAEKAGHDPVRYGPESASEPLMTCRKRMDDVETGGKSLTRDKSGRCPDFGPDGIRHEGGATVDQALARNVGTCRPDVKGEIQAGGPREDQSTESGHRGGAVCSRGEGSGLGVNQRWEEPRG